MWSKRIGQLYRHPALTTLGNVHLTFPLGLSPLSILKQLGPVIGHLYALRGNRRLCGQGGRCSDAPAFLFGGDSKFSSYSHARLVAPRSRDEAFV